MLLADGPSSVVVLLQGIGGLDDDKLEARLPDGGNLLGADGARLGGILRGQVYAEL